MPLDEQDFHALDGIRFALNQIVRTDDEDNDSIADNIQAIADSFQSDCSLIGQIAGYLFNIENQLKRIADHITNKED